MTSRDKIYSQLTQLAIGDFADIVKGAKVVEGKLRLLLKDHSFIDIWLSVKKKGVYAYHWERRDIDGTLTISLGVNPILSFFLPQFSQPSSV